MRFGTSQRATAKMFASFDAASGNARDDASSGRRRRSKSCPLSAWSLTGSFGVALVEPAIESSLPPGRF